MYTSDTFLEVAAPAKLPIKKYIKNIKLKISLRKFKKCSFIVILHNNYKTISYLYYHLLLYNKFQ